MCDCPYVYAEDPPASTAAKLEGALHQPAIRLVAMSRERGRDLTRWGCDGPAQLGAKTAPFDGTPHALPSGEQ
jgi:hypothetical protein